MTVAARCASVSVLVVLALGLRDPAPPRAAVEWAGVAGIVGSVGLLALYQALAIGQMGVTTPISGLLSAGLPVLFTAAVKGLPTAVQTVGFGLALTAVWLLSRPEGPLGRPAGLGLALLSGVGFGGFLILIAQASHSAVLWPLTVANAASLATLLMILAVMRQPLRPAAGSLPLALLAGILDVGGNAFFLLAAHLGRLDVAAVLASLYPASTVLLAWAVLKERVSRMRAAGIAVALASIPLIVG